MATIRNDRMQAKWLLSMLRDVIMVIIYSTLSSKRKLLQSKWLLSSRLLLTQRPRTWLLSIVEHRWFVLIHIVILVVAT